MTTAPADMQSSGPVRLERDGSVAVIVIDNPPVNASSWEVRSGLLRAVVQARADATVTGIVLIGAGSTFIAGADIREFGKPPRDPQLPDVIKAIEACAKPVVAALHGSALGGGFELTLGCDARVAVKEAVVGLPEVTLGIIPGAGGTQRLARLVGLSTAIEIITSGRRVPAAEALKRGMIDAIVTGDLRAAAVAHAAKASKRRVRDLPVPPEPAEAVEKAATAATSRARGRSAVLAAIESVRNATRLPIDAALTEERAAFQRLRVSEESAALRYLFFAQRAAGRIEGAEKATPRPVAKVGVIGGGTMGSGIAVCFLDAGLPVTLVERDQASLDRGIERVRGIYKRLVDSGRVPAEESDKRLSKLTPSTSLAALADADLVVEAVFEDLALKQSLFRELDGVLKRGAVLASNTSYLDIDAMAGATQRAADVAGLHFFSPANVMKLIEIVRAKETAPDVLATALAVAKKIGKLPVIARVGEGFIGNRIYSAYRTQCEFMLEEGALPEQVDAALTAFGFAMGPFAVGDLSGLDIAWATRKRLAATRDPKARFPTILDRLCEAGRFGQKTGGGWYNYPPGAKRGEPDPLVQAVIESISRERGFTRRAFTPEEIQWRALAAMTNESALLLAEGIAARPSDVDLVLVNGYGFPSHKGGPLFWASRRPRNEVRAALDTLAAATGHGFRRGDIDAVLDQVAAL